MIDNVLQISREQIEKAIAILNPCMNDYIYVLYLGHSCHSFLYTFLMLDSCFPPFYYKKNDYISKGRCNRGTTLICNFCYLVCI